MTILHGDDRVYNNIMIQTYPVNDKTPQDFDYNQAGTAAFDIFPTYEEWIAQFNIGKEPDMKGLGKAHFGHLPVWIDGNAYFNGANVFAKEKKNFINDTDKAFFELTAAEDGSFSVNTNVYELLQDYRVDIIDSDVLGKAFEPEQRFENPDGSTIHFDTDYFGRRRYGKNAYPGPFADPDKI